MRRITSDLDESDAATDAVRLAPDIALARVAVRAGTDTRVVTRAEARADHGEDGAAHLTRHERLHRCARRCTSRRTAMHAPGSTPPSSRVRSQVRTPVNGEADTGQNTQCPSDAPRRWPMPAQPARSSEADSVTASGREAPTRVPGWVSRAAHDGQRGADEQRNGPHRRTARPVVAAAATPRPASPGCPWTSPCRRGCR